MNLPSPPPAARMDRKKEDTRQKIITAAMSLIDQHGYPAVTMEQIAETADIAKGTLYNYFPVKEAIVTAYLERESLARNQERIQRLRQLPDTRSRLTASLSELMEAVRSRQEIFEVYFTYRTQQMISLKRDDTHVGGLRSLESEIIRLGQEQGEIRADLPTSLLEALYEFIFIILAQAFYQGPDQFQPQQVIPACVDLFMNGVQNRKESGNPHG